MAEKKRGRPKKYVGPPATMADTRRQSTRTNRIAYLYAKVLGRRSRNGQLPPSYLGPRHKAIIALHLQGNTGVDIAKIVGCTTMTVHRILSSDAAKPYLDEFHQAIDNDIRGLSAKAIAAFDGALSSGDTTERISAAKEVMKLANKYPRSDEDFRGGATAADLINNVLGLARESIEGIRRLDRKPTAQIVDAEHRLLESGDD